MSKVLNSVPPNASSYDAINSFPYAQFSPWSTPASEQVMRGIGRLADNATIIATVFDNNKSTSAFGNKDNVQQIAFQKSTDNGATWTSLGSNTFNTGVTDGVSIAIYSMCIDDSNNIHIVYVAGNFNAAGRNVKYMKLTFSGGSWTNGTPITVFTYATSFGPMGVDIDLIGTGATACPVILVMDQTSTSMNSTAYMIPSNGTGTLKTIESFSVTGGTFLNGGAYVNNGSVAGLHEAFISGTDGVFCALEVRGYNASTNTNQIAYKIYQINMTTGAITASYDEWGHGEFLAATGFNENWQVFTTHTRQFTVVGTNTTIGNNVATNSINAYRLTLPSSGLASVTLGLAVTHYVPQNTSSISQPIWMFCYAMVDDDTFVVFYSDDNGTYSGGSVWNGVIKWTQDPVSAVWSAALPARWWETDDAAWMQNNLLGFSPIGVAFTNRTLIYSGANNHQPKDGSWDLVQWYYNYNGTTYARLYNRNQHLSAPTIVTPASGATIQTDTPGLSATVAHITLLGITDAVPMRQSRSKIKWQFATDAGFTTNLITYLMDDSGFQRVDANVNGGNFALGSSTNDSTSITSTVPTSKKIAQAPTVYARAAEVDEFGGTSAYSTVITFTNAHAPSASGVAPANGTFQSYGTGTVTFQWYFSDPWIQDNQTAYQIQVVDTTTGSTIADSGKVAQVGSPGAFTTLMSASLSIPGTSANKPLTWRVRVWDSDDVAGAYSGAQGFELTVPPTVVVTAPTNASTVTTATPTVTWTPTYAGTATANQYRVVVSQGGTVTYDTGFVSGTGTSYQIPLGILHNLNGYTFQVYIKDSLGLISAPAQTSVSVSLTLPASPPSIQVFTYDYETLGFVWVGWDNTAQDPAFFYWNVYRRVSGTTAWLYLSSVDTSASLYGYADYTAKSGVTYQYCVTQVAYNTGALVESAFTAIASVSVVGNYYWILDGLGQLVAVPLLQASKDSFNDEHERNTYTVIGRGRHEDIGEYLGVNGSLTCQLRDKVLSGLANRNSLMDPSFQNNIPSSPQWTVTSTGTLNSTVLSPLEPAPSGKLRVVKFDAATGPVSWSQVLPVLPGVNGDTLFVSCYLYNTAASGTYSVAASVVYKNSSGTTLATHNLTLASIENWQGNSRWFRYGSTETFPSGAVATVTVTYTVTVATGTGLSFMMTGNMITKGATVIPYGDGDTQAWTWDGAQYASSSSTSGFYTARQQRQDVKEMTQLDRPLYLRTPFGDLYLVSPGDVGFDRLAGVGPSAEFGDLTFPYQEVAL